MSQPARNTLQKEETGEGKHNYATKYIFNQCLNAEISVLLIQDLATVLSNTRNFYLYY